MDRIAFVDSHTGGEPTRALVGGLPELPGSTLADQAEAFRAEFDYVRTASVLEPRGGSVWVGAWLTEIGTANPHVIFFNEVGRLGMCGHGTIGVVETLHHLGKLPSARITLRTPAGDVPVQRHEGGEVSLRNVPARAVALDVTVDVPGIGTVRGDVAYGGNWFFLIYDSPYPIRLEAVPELTSFALRVRSALASAGITGDRGEMIDHVEVFGPAADARNHSRNFVLCPGTAYDRSPCGTGTSAKLAALHARGSLRLGEPYRQESITSSVFEGRLESDGPNLRPVITGRAHIMAEGHLLLDPADPLRHGFRG